MFNMPSIADKSAIALLNEFTEANAGPFFQKVVRTAAALFGVYTVYKFLWKFIPGAHRLPKMELKNKTVLIVGASTGLGRALAFEFYARGAKLILAARSLDKLKELCVELKNTGAEKGWNNENQPDFGYLDLNNGTTTSIEKQVETLIRNKDAKIDVLVSNAGLSNRGSCMETSMVVQRRVMEVISSIQGRFALPYRSAYSASKHALEAYFASLRAEERFGRLQVLTVSAGYLNTSFGTRALNPAGRPMGVEDANQLHGMAPESAASKIVDSLQNRESELVLAPLNVKMGFYIRNLTPNLFWWFLYRRAVKELEANAKANENVVT